MKRLSLVLVSVALVLGMAQCKKNVEPVTPVATVEPVSISLKVDGSSKVDVNTGTGAVTFEDGDVIYVACNASYVGTLTYDGSYFTGDITSSEDDDAYYLYFYFMGNKTPSETLTVGTTTLTVSISDQTDGTLPVISAGRSNEKFSTSTSVYTSTLLNKCALVRFDVTSSSSHATIVPGVNDKMSVTFASGNVGTFTPSQDNGVIRLAAGSGTRWAIMLKQDAVEDDVAYSQDLMYHGTFDIPAISNNDFLDDGIDVTMTAMPYFTVNSSGKKVRFAPGNLYTENGTYYLQPDQLSYVNSTATSGTTFDKYAQSIVLEGGAFTGTSQTVSGYTGNWYALTRDEWKYLLNVNNNSASDVGQRSGVVGTVNSTAAYFMKCKVNSVQGIVIFPDGFAWDATKMGTTPTSINGWTASYTANSTDYTLANWAHMEAAGCVFLPAAGYSGGSVGSYGNYWSSTSGNYRLDFSTSYMSVNSGTYSFCVRLAAVVE